MSNEICSHLLSLVRNVRNLNTEGVVHFCRKFNLRYGSRKEMTKSLQRFKSSVKTLKCFGKKNDEICLNIQRIFS